MVDTPSNLSKDQQRYVEEIMEKHGYTELTETQKQAFEDGVLSNDNTLLVAETGNGKTLVAETILKQSLEQGGTAAYLVPSYQLTQAKKEEINEWLNDYEAVVGTGGIGDKKIPVMTFESFFQSIMRNVKNIRSIDQVIFDDFHEIYSYNRGTGIEKAITACLYENINIFAMSATVGNPDELADWMNAELIMSRYDRSIPVVETPIERDSSSTKGKQIAEIIDKRKDRKPFLVFNNRRDWAESRAEKIAKTQLFTDTNSKDYTSKIESRLQTEMTSKYEKLGELMEKGVAFHHSGLNSNVRDLIVDAVQEGDLMCISATPGLAYGFDAPIRSVVVADLKRFGDYVGVYEYVQWVGRAGRPGYGYDEGYAFPIVSDERADDVFQFHLPAKEKELEPVKTHIESDPEFRQLTLELIDFGWNTPDELEDFIRESLYWEQFDSFGAWGEYQGERSIEIEKKLQQTVKWLDRRGLIDKKHTAEEFETTRLGEASIEFTYSTWLDTPLEKITGLYHRLPTVKDEPIKLVNALIKTFDRMNIRDLPDDEQFRSKVIDAGLTPSDEGLSTGLLCFYWCQGEQLSTLEQKYNIDPTTIPNAGRRVSDLLNATSYLFEADTALTKPPWYDVLSGQMRNGVSAENVYLADEVKGLGRGKIQNVESHVTQLPATDNSNTLPEQLHTILDEYNEEQLRDVLKSVNGVGTVIAKRTISTVKEWDGKIEQRKLPDLEEGIDKDNDSNNDNRGFTRASKLDEFTNDKN